MIREQAREAPSGVLPLVALLAALLADVVLAAVAAPLLWEAGGWVLLIVTSLLLPAIVFLALGLFAVGPNEARVLQLFGRYVGTVRSPGLRYANPLYTKRRISVRVRNFETERSKVNDADGNPIEIAAVVVWRVVDTAAAAFRVDDYVNFVHVQSESAVRNLASQYPYDSGDDGAISLRGDTDAIADRLKQEIQGRLDEAGVDVMEARITHLAYAPEIASAMLQRQQAGAIVAARSLIVEGAVSMVQMALDDLASRSVVELDEEQKAAMVSNLLVVLCADKSAQPVLRTDGFGQ